MRDVGGGRSEPRSACGVTGADNTVSRVVVVKNGRAGGRQRSREQVDETDRCLGEGRPSERRRSCIGVYSCGALVTIIAAAVVEATARCRHALAWNAPVQTGPLFAPASCHLNCLMRPGQRSPVASPTASCSCHRVCPICGGDASRMRDCILKCTPLPRWTVPDRAHITNTSPESPLLGFSGRNKYIQRKQTPAATHARATGWAESDTGH
jgi:hypothetical protein